ncbi:MAG TPA: TylF/MycF/NovP-related O-methyltransferase [Methylibium sp.]|nr:TylF/MycF/NovP-related O-methyltransferase [Methylibium sp.]
MPTTPTPSETDLGVMLGDVRAYMEGGHFDAAFEMLAEHEAGLAGEPQRFAEASNLINLAYRYFVFGGAPGPALDALRLLFRVAARIDRDVGAVDADYLGIYLRALMASKSSALPLRRVLRQSTLVALFRDCAAGEGSVVECGCARGNSFLQLCFQQAALRPGWQGEGFAIFDSFQGLSEPEAVDLDTSGMDPAEARRVLSMTKAGGMAYAYDEVSSQVWSEFPRVAIHPGWLPESLRSAPEARYRFVHVDVDLYAPTLGCFEYFYPRLLPGGIIVTDDYNWPGGRRAVDEFCAARGLKPRFTATHQAHLVAP